MSGTARALVVYESMFGNTQRIAAAIGEGLRPAFETEVLAVGQTPRTLPGDVRLLVVGGPTHAFGMSRPSTRDQAAAQGPMVMPATTGVREWLEMLGPRRTETVAATFDTRVNKVRRLPGSAARAAARRLRHQEYEVIAAPASFYVGDMTGPLDEGEVDRARKWGEQLVIAQGSRPAGATHHHRRGH
ncbi:flavodoxin [Kribbella amoyensis]|uniref:Flavodoxin n=1 Tax=Kribbella amoyensis TaxID=996641 RepID=A0A561AZJ4_9ACTN|nr:flavodoxin family protein [Kribbella amoyensis]TWD72008.1 flavodoxin [Kribbella amoyensis]